MKLFKTMLIGSIHTFKIIVWYYCLFRDPHLKQTAPVMLTPQYGSKLGSPIIKTVWHDRLFWRYRDGPILLSPDGSFGKFKPCVIFYI